MSEMVTDDERRKIAQRLRKASGTAFYGDYIKEAIGCDGSKDPYECLADLIEPNDPPFNLYTLYEAVFHRSPRCWECIEDDEAEKLIDQLMELCNAPGHEHIKKVVRDD